MHPSVHCRAIHNSQDMETSQVPIDRWLYKDADWKEWNTSICSNMNRLKEYHTKWNIQTEKDKYYIWHRLYVDLKNNTN